MPDRHAHPVPADLTEIDVEEESALRFWSAELGTSIDRLLAAIRAVGSDSAHVRWHLAG